ncbi:aminopeptidase [Gorillibacterium sp. sgz5001074]|uniref:aminopeptidase n=1 Tax=Gorillibacterium sp. sgz5001074 TaxID=3446695 RepID=UPI003F662C7E
MEQQRLETYMDRYAELIVRIGLNLQQGQSLFVNANLDSAPFARKVVRKAYEAGARQVYVDWNDETVTRIKYECAPDEAFTEYPLWKSKGLEEFMEQGGAYLQIYAPNPELLKGIPSGRVSAANKTAAEANKGFRSYLYKGSNVWAMASVPTPAWAAKVFPELDPEAAAMELWDKIFRVNRIYEEDPVAAWEAHLAALQSRVDLLNAKRYRALHYRGPGTDLRVELPEGHVWFGGSNPTTAGVRFLPNLPTEEVFTLPRKDGVHGTVKGTLPLNYSGTMIEGFSLTFRDGRIVDYSAEKGLEALTSLIEMDEGSHYLGEVALVPHRSPISDLGVIFYNTLFDENASCHLAIGNAYPYTLKDGTGMTPEELDRHGANRSLAHVDFMMGSAGLDIDGETADGSLEPLFRQGNWAL